MSVSKQFMGDVVDKAKHSLDFVTSLEAPFWRLVSGSQVDEPRELHNWPFFSIVIPAFNESQYLPRCLASLSRLGYPGRFEVIVVDNGSTDATSEIARRFGARVVHETTKGVTHARQAGFHAASGELIASLDADSTVPADWLCKYAQAFEQESGCVGVYGLVEFYDGRRIDRLAAKHVSGNFLKVNHLLGKPHFAGMNFAVRRSAFERIGGFRVELPSAEDLDLSLRLKGEGRIVLRSDIKVQTSSRRMREGYTEFVRHNAINYVNVAWLGRMPEDFRDVR